MERSKAIDVTSMEIDLVVLEQSHSILSVTVDDGVEEQISPELTHSRSRHLI